MMSVYSNTEYDENDARVMKIVELIRVVNEKRLHKPQELALSEVFSVERAILRLQNLDSLRARAFELREQYRTIFGEDAMAV